MFWSSGVSTILTACLGMLGNLLSILVLTRKEMSSMFNKLLLFLCLADLVFLLSSLGMSPIALQIYGIYPVWVYNMFECLCHVTLAISVFLTTSITIERHQASIYSILAQACGVPAVGVRAVDCWQ